jgi:flavin reductase (DIM6/NTAB) family NADH-FMN oxidoreductase RutF
MPGQTILHGKDFETMTDRHRATLINSISGFKSLGLIGTINEHGITNISVFNSIVHIGAFPPLLGMVFRPDSVRRHTLENILSQKHYTINQVHEAMLPMAHQTSAKYDADVSEFDACGFTPEFSAIGKAPYISESKVKMLLEYRMHFPIPLNDTFFLIGEIIEIKAPTDIIQEDGFVDIHAAGTLTVTGLDAYFSTNFIDRYPYARPQTTIQSLMNRSEERR